MYCVHLCCNTLNFNPRTSHEVRPRNLKIWKRVLLFQSTHLSRGATNKLNPAFASLPFQSTHLSRGATSMAKNLVPINKHFNPRTSHEVRLDTVLPMPISSNFNPRTSHEVRRKTAASSSDVPEFQSTHLSRGATFFVVFHVVLFWISIHAPLTRCDKIRSASRLISSHFNPRTSHEVRLDFALW